MHFDETHCYYRKDLKPQDFTNTKWDKKDKELFGNPMEILDTSESIL